MSYFICTSQLLLVNFTQHFSSSGFSVSHNKTWSGQRVGGFCVNYDFLTARNRSNWGLKRARLAELEVFYPSGGTGIITVG